MPTKRTCPDAHKLESLLLGQLPPGEREALGEHLLRCDRCATTVQTLKAEDTLVEAMRGADLSEEPDDTRDEVLSGLMARLRGLRPAPAPEESVASAPRQPPGGRDSTRWTGGGGGAGPEPVRHDFLAPPQAPDEIGRLGPYRVLRVLGAGGMGIVFHAEDPHLKRPVALKVMKPALAASQRARQRFLREAQTAAALDHDHIVHIYQVGEDNGVPFLAMQLLKGEPLDERLERETKLRPADVLRIGREAAEGLAAAHGAGLIHRDVKPANIWLEGSRGRVKLLDFGLARAPGDAHLTQPGTISGTPAYMAPEQARGEEVDARCDLFSLGCTLYCLATGRPPFRGDNSLAVLTSLALDRPQPPQELNPDLPSALAELILRLLAKDPADRPASAREVADALQAIERGTATPTSLPFAGTPSARPEGRRPVRRQVLVATAVALLLLGGGGLVAPQIILRITGKDGKVREVPIEPGDKIEFVQKDVAKPPAVAAGSFDALDPARIPAAERFAWQPKELVAVLGEHRQRHWGYVGSLAVRPDGKQVATGGHDGRIRIWDAATQREQFTLRGDHHTLAYSADGKRLTDGVTVWDVSGPEAKKIAKLDADTGYPVGAAFAPNGKGLVVSRDEGDSLVVWLWDLDEAGPRVRARFRGCDWGAISPDGRTLAVAHCEDQSVRLYDLAEAKPKQRAALPGAEGKVLVSIPGAGAPRLAFAPDGRLATFHGRAAGLSGVTLRLWDLSGKEPRVQATVKEAGFLVAFAADGKRMATADANTVRVWSLQRAGPMRTALRGVNDRVAGNVNAMALTPAGDTVITGHLNGAVRFWKVVEDALVEKAPVNTQPTDLYGSTVVLPHIPALASRADDSRLRLWRLGGAAPAELPLPDDLPLDGWPLAATTDGKVLVTQSRNGDTVRLWGAEGTTLREAATFAPFPKSQAVSAAFSPDGKTLALGGQGAISLWDLSGAAPKERATAAGQKGAVHLVAFSRDGRTLFSRADDNIVRVWRAAGEGLSEQPGRVDPGTTVYRLAVAPDGKTLALGTDNAVELWDLSGARPRKGAALPTPARSVAFSPDGRALVTANQGGDLVVWDAEKARELRRWKLPGVVGWVAFAPDGRHLVTVNGNGTVYVLRLAPAKPPLTRP